jgi:hypothetical protein
MRWMLLTCLAATLVVTLLVMDGRLPCRVPRFVAVAMHSNNQQFIKERQKRAQRIDTIPFATCPLVITPGIDTSILNKASSLTTTTTTSPTLSSAITNTGSSSSSENSILSSSSPLLSSSSTLSSSSSGNSQSNNNNNMNKNNKPDRIQQQQQQTEQQSSQTILPRIQLLLYANGEAQEKYKNHLNLINCYAKKRNIPVLVLDPFQYEECDSFHDIFFLRHCVTALFIKCADYTLFMDLDVIPQIELDDWEPYLRSYDLVFSQVTEGGEIAAGTFLIKNTDYSRDFLMDWASRESFQKCWNANGDQTPLHQLLMDRVRINSRERAECDLYLERQKWPSEVQQFIRCAVWWIRVGSQWDEHIYITDMSDALTMTIRDYNAENIVNSEPGWSSMVSLPGMGKKYERTNVPLPLSKHPFIHQIKPDTLHHFIDISRIEYCDDDVDWKIPWLPYCTMPLSMPPFPRGADGHHVGERY